MNRQLAFDTKEKKAPDSVESYKFEPIQGYPMLHWKGKRPFQSTQYYPAQLKEIHGESVDGWRNEIYWGDNLQVMSHMLKKYRGKIKLVYIDPPFDSKADYKKKIQLRGEKFTNDYNSFEEKQYTDIWTNDEYLQFMYERLILIKELMDDDGSLYLHCDWHKSHLLRCLLDEIFGSNKFRNEIVWYYPDKFATGGKSLDKNHDLIFHYSKGEEFIGNEIRIEKPEVTRRALRKKVDGKTVDVRDEQGEKIFKEYSDKKIDDVWQIGRSIPNNEYLGYPTQKKDDLIERIISYGSDEGDLILDCFIGSGTTAAVAQKFGRRCIGCDINLGAIQITTRRLLQLASELNHQNGHQNGKPIKYYTGFSVYNVNNYDIFRNPVEAKDLLKEALEINPFDHNSIYDGEKDGRMVKIMPVNRIATRADLNELITGFDQKTFERRQEAHPNKPVEKLLLVCMGHEPDLAAHLENEVRQMGFRIDVEVVDILRDKANLEFKRDSEAKINIKKGKLVVENFYPLNLLQKLSLLKENVEDWRELVESVMIDWNYDGTVFKPAVVDVPEKNTLVAGSYDVPDDAGTIRVKITDLLSESLEVEVQNG